MGLRRTALLIMLAASPACAQPSPPATTTAATPTASSAAKPDAPVRPPVLATGTRIFLPPPDHWTSDLLSNDPALQQTNADFAALTGGLAFGMSPRALNADLANPYPDMSWQALALANEYPGEVRFFGLPFSAAGPLRMGIAACAGAQSYIAFLFNSSGFLRMSYRLIPDRTCPDTNDAAQELLSHFVPLSQNVARSVRYRTGKTQVVDITDPQAAYLATVRWRQGGF